MKWEIIVSEKNEIDFKRERKKNTHTLFNLYLAYLFSNNNV